jgi:hypothetical protein
MEDKYYKILNADLCHHGLQYKVGEVTIDPKPHGLHFTRFEHLHRWLHLFHNSHSYDELKLAEVTLPPGAVLVIKGDILRSNQLVVHEPKLLWQCDEIWNDPSFCRLAMASAPLIAIRCLALRNSVIPDEIFAEIGQFKSTIEIGALMRVLKKDDRVRLTSFQRLLLIRVCGRFYSQLSNPSELETIWYLTCSQDGTEVEFDARGPPIKQLMQMYNGVMPSMDDHKQMHPDMSSMAYALATYKDHYGLWQSSLRRVKHGPLASYRSLSEIPFENLVVAVKSHGSKALLLEALQRKNLQGDANATAAARLVIHAMVFEQCPLYEADSKYITPMIRAEIARLRPEMIRWLPGELTRDEAMAFIRACPLQYFDLPMHNTYDRKYGIQLAAIEASKGELVGRRLDQEFSIESLNRALELKPSLMETPWSELQWWIPDSIATFFGDQDRRAAYLRDHPGARLHDMPKSEEDLLCDSSEEAEEEDEEVVEEEEEEEEEDSEDGRVEPKDKGDDEAEVAHAAKRQRV